MPDLGILGLELEKHPRICLIAKFQGKTKMPKFGTKSGLFEYFWARILLTYLNQHPQICLTAKFYEKTKIPTFGTKYALFGYFWTIILKKLLLYLKSAPSN